MVRTTKQRIDGGFYDSPVFSEYFKGLKFVAADIETAGLSPENSAVILGGAVIPDDSDPDSRHAVQFFADSFDDEYKLLKSYIKLLNNYDCIVTYNGHQFDIPFLKKRMERHRMESYCLDRLYSLDMYRILKKYSELPKILPDMKQKSVEDFLTGNYSGKYYRTDRIDGRMSVDLYYRYVRSNYDDRGHLLDQILLHNSDDIIMLSEIIELFKKTDIHAAMFGTGFPVYIDSGELFIIDRIRLLRKSIKIEGRGVKNARTFAYYGDGLKADTVSGKYPEAPLSLKMEISCRTVKAGGEYLIADIKRLGPDPAEFQKLAGYESGYLILASKVNGQKIINHREINTLIRKGLSWILSKECQN